MDEGNVLNDVLQRTLDFVDRGFGLIQGDVYWLFGALLVLNLALAGLTWATSDDDTLVALARRVLYLGFFAWLVTSWPTLVDTVGDSFVRLGLKAGNAAGLERDFYNPGRVVSVGWSGAWNILETTSQFTGVRATFVNLPQILILLIAAIVYFVCFALLAFQVFLALVQFKIGTLASFVLLPMALVNKTAFLAERPIGWVIAKRHPAHGPGDGDGARRRPRQLGCDGSRGIDDPSSRCRGAGRGRDLPARAIGDGFGRRPRARRAEPGCRRYRSRRGESATGRAGYGRYGSGRPSGRERGGPRDTHGRRQGRSTGARRCGRHDRDDGGRCRNKDCPCRRQDGRRGSQDREAAMSVTHS